MRKTAQTMFKEEAKDMAGAASADIERVRLEMQHAEQDKRDKEARERKARNKSIMGSILGQRTSTDSHAHSLSGGSMAHM